MKLVHAIYFGYNVVHLSGFIDKIINMKKKKKKYYSNMTICGVREEKGVIVICLVNKGPSQTQFLH